MNVANTIYAICYYDANEQSSFIDIDSLCYSKEEIEKYAKFHYSILNVEWYIATYELVSKEHPIIIKRRGI